MWPTTDVTREAFDMTHESGINALNFKAEHSNKEDEKKGA